MSSPMLKEQQLLNILFSLLFPSLIVIKSCGIKTKKKINFKKKYSSKNLDNMQANTVTKFIKSNDENSVFGIDTV